MIIKILLSLFLLALLPGLSVTFLFYIQKFINCSDLIYYFIGGSIGGIIIDQILFRKIRGFEVFEHELTHAISALLFFRSVNKFKVTRHEGGYVSHRGSFGGQFGDDFIGLAPYFLPTFTFFSVLFYPLVLKQSQLFIQIFWIWIGFSFGFHLWSTLREIKENFNYEVFTSAGTGENTRSDIGKRGLIFSFIFITSLTLLFHTFIIVILTGGYSEVPDWFGSIWNFTVLKIGHLYEYIRGL